MAKLTRQKLVEQLGLQRSAPVVARRLLGCELVRKTAAGICRVRIVETEAYREGDPASHSCNGKTARSQVMFGLPGYWYVYLCYGMHWMINVVCGPETSGEAVLIRAGEPIQGLEIMQKNRGTDKNQLSNGPAKLAEALGVDGEYNEKPCDPETGFFIAISPEVETMYESPRVGISVGTERYWRYYIKNDYLSGAPQNVAGRRRN